MRSFTAPLIFHEGKLQSDLCIRTRNEGEIVSVDSFVDVNAEFIEGILCPGFVNAHCHLELSHLKGLIPEGTGMAAFGSQIVKMRGDFQPEQVQENATEAAMKMLKNGIVAVGDISNNAVTAKVKKNISGDGIRFHTFVELICFFEEKVSEIFLKGISVLNEFEAGCASLAPHAPYSVTQGMLEIIATHCSEQSHRTSVHLLESEEERRMFEKKEGPLMEMMQNLNLPFVGQNWNSSLNYILHSLPENLPAALMVHMTESRPEELQKVIAGWPDTYFVLCPRANQYIHRTLPDALLFDNIASNKICIGTDSLASNHSLDILAEIKTLQVTFPDLQTETLLNWATINGAKALGFEHEIGRFAPGTKPGINQITHVNAESGKFTVDSTVRKIQ